jgi:hypothetical protein
MATHFFTISVGEYQAQLGRTDVRVRNEGVACYVRATVPLYRFRSGATHFYTADKYRAIVGPLPANYTFAQAAEHSTVFYGEGIAAEVFPYPFFAGLPTDRPAVPFTPLVRCMNTSTGVHFFQVGGNALPPGFQQIDVDSTVPINATPGQFVDFYHLTNPSTGDHFYTIDTDEVANAEANFGYVSNGAVCLVIPPPYTTPLYRLYNPKAGDHLYTSDITEVQQAVQLGYTYEGIACGIFAQQEAGTRPLLRLYNHDVADRLYTVSEVESTQAQKQGYRLETSPGYVYPPETSNIPLTMALNRVLIG